MKKILKNFMATTASPLLVARITVGLVFLTEGIQKFLYPAILGEGRFEKNRIQPSRILGFLYRYI